MKNSKNTALPAVQQKTKIKSKKENMKVKINEDLSKIGGGFNDFVISIRTGMFFDTQKQTRLKPQHYHKITNYYNKHKIVIIVDRDENSIIHQRVFEVLLTLGELKVNESGQKFLEVSNMYQLKKLAGLNVKKSDSDVIEIIEQISDIKVKINKISDDGKRTDFLRFQMLGNTRGTIENLTGRAKGFRIRLDDDFVDAIQYLNKIKIDKDKLQYIHQRVKSPFTERIIKHFMIQQVSQEFKGNGFWNLLSTICDIPYAVIEKQRIEFRLKNLSRMRKWQIVNEIASESQLMAEFGIKFDKKNLKLEYNSIENTHKNAVMIGYSEV